MNADNFSFLVLFTVFLVTGTLNGDENKIMNNLFTQTNFHVHTERERNRLDDLWLKYVHEEMRTEERINVNTFGALSGDEWYKIHCQVFISPHFLSSE